ncbi:MAG: UDP-glucose 4-epimerase GalE [Bacteroidia bacterium]
MKVLVTGGLGYIGSHTVVELQHQGHDVVIVDDLSNSRASVVEGIEAINGIKPKWYNLDIRRTDELKQIIESEEIKAVIHFAAHKAVGESVEQPLKYYNNNVGGLLSLIEAMGDLSNKKMIFSSSCTVYGDTKDSPIAENQPVVAAISPYGTTKIISEELLEDLAIHSKLQTVSLRYFNPVGAHDSGLIGELPLGVPSNLVPYITQTAAGILSQLTVFGNDYNTPDGTNIRDFIHVVDLAKAHVKALDFACNESFQYEVFNLGTGRGNSVLEVIESFERTSGKTLNYRIGGRRAGDVEQIWADASKAHDILGWKTELELDDMTLSAWNWQLKLS